MKQYLELLQEVLETGRVRGDRTGTGTIGIFDARLKYDLSKGEFPLLTTKFVSRKLAWREFRSILNGELHMESMITDDGKGDFWAPWRLKENVSAEVELENYERLRWLEENNEDAYIEFFSKKISIRPVEEGHVWLDSHNVPRTRSVVAHHANDLNAPYGSAWRNFSEDPLKKKGVDQVAYVLDLLRNNPESRRILISAWNPLWMPDEKVSPQENIINGKPCLTPCHFLVEFYVEEMTTTERLRWCRDNANPYFQDLWEDHMSDCYAEEHCNQPKMSAERKAEWLTENHVPTQWLSLKYSMRSVDLPVGEPYNQAFYAFMLLAFAHELGMAPNQLIGNLTNVHIYLNQIEEVKLQLTREPYKPVECFVRSEHYCNSEIPKKGLFDLTFEDFVFTEYKHHPAIKIEVSV